MTSKLGISDVNSLPDVDFEGVFGNVIELCADAAKHVKSKRPFKSVEEICAAFRVYLEEINIEGPPYKRVTEPELTQDYQERTSDTTSSSIYDGSKTVGNLFDFTEKLTILKLHPDLAGRLAAQGELTKESTNEQQSAGLHELTADEKKLMDESNQRYKEKFGFPFIICARENKVQSIIAGLQTRYHNTRDQEINTGIGEVKKICTLRILDIMKNV